MGVRVGVRFRVGVRVRVPSVAFSHLQTTFSRGETPAELTWGLGFRFGFG